MNPEPHFGYAIPRMYFHDNEAVELAFWLRPSARAELEITDVNHAYLERRQLREEVLGRGVAWLDAERHASLLQASGFVQAVQKLAGWLGAGNPPGTARGHLRAGLVHNSTDCVFDGAKGEPYTEDDQANPLNPHRRGKLAGDRAIEAVDGAYPILRRGWAYGLRRQNFLTAIRRQSP